MTKQLENEYRCPSCKSLNTSARNLTPDEQQRRGFFRNGYWTSPTEKLECHQCGGTYYRSKQ